MFSDARNSQIKDITFWYRFGSNLRALENRGFEFTDTEDLDALDPTDEQEAERIEALYEWLRGELRP